MKIRVEQTYTAQTALGEKVIPLGVRARIIFLDGSYHSGDIEKITVESVTISRGDGEYTFPVGELADIEI